MKKETLIYNCLYCQLNEQSKDLFFNLVDFQNSWFTNNDPGKIIEYWCSDSYSVGGGSGAGETDQFKLKVSKTRIFPKLNSQLTFEKTPGIVAEWHKAYSIGTNDMFKFTINQISICIGRYK